MAILRHFLIFQLFCQIVNTEQPNSTVYQNQSCTQPIDVKFQTLFVENGIWSQNYMDFLKVEEDLKEFKIGSEWR